MKDLHKAASFSNNGFSDSVSDLQSQYQDSSFFFFCLSCRAQKLMSPASLSFHNLLQQLQLPTVKYCRGEDYISCIYDWQINLVLNPGQLWMNDSKNFHAIYYDWVRFQHLSVLSKLLELFSPTDPNPLDHR